MSRMSKLFSAVKAFVRSLFRKKQPEAHDPPGPVSSTLMATKQVSPLFMDTYEGDYETADWAKVFADPLYYGIILKATEGNYYSPLWFTNNWPKVKAAAGTAYGTTKFRGVYHYLKFNLDGKLQADYLLSAVTKAGGWDVGDLWPMIDAELGNDGTDGGHRDSNQDASAQQIIDCVSACADQLHSELGRQVILYGSNAMRERNITSRMSCDWLAIPRYTATLPMSEYTGMGWSLDKLLFWQFYGDGATYLQGYPTVTPLGKSGDISVMVMNGGIETMRGQLFVKP